VRRRPLLPWLGPFTLTRLVAMASSSACDGWLTSPHWPATTPRTSPRLTSFASTLPTWVLHYDRTTISISCQLCDKEEAEEEDVVELEEVVQLEEVMKEPDEVELVGKSLRMERVEDLLDTDMKDGTGFQPTNPPNPPSTPSLLRLRPLDSLLAPPLPVRREEVVLGEEEVEVPMWEEDPPVSPPHTSLLSRQPQALVPSPVAPLAAPSNLAPSSYHPMFSNVPPLLVPATTPLPATPHPSTPLHAIPNPSTPLPYTPLSLAAGGHFSRPPLPTLDPRALAAPPGGWKG